jgi:putative transposase
MSLQRAGPLDASRNRCRFSISVRIAFPFHGWRFVCVSPAIVADVSIMGEHVVAVLDRLKASGLPKRLAVDNGPEFISKALDAWAYRTGVTLEFSRPGKRTDNAFAESFNGHFRAERLDQHWFASLEEARQIIEAWRIEYSTERTHQALKYGPSAAFAASWEEPKEVAD